MLLVSMKTASLAFLAVTVCNLVKFGHAQENCGLDKFQCANGACIQSVLLCDGRADCSDASDETASKCTKPDLVCPTYAFRCAYGACVDGDSVCNGVKDCHDNSDEAFCGGTQNGTCTMSQFQCDNKQCIDIHRACDGVRDCRDGSDETSAKCSDIDCPTSAFRCAYGACIDGDLKCNGVENCADGSDESACTTSGTPTTPHRPTPPSRPSTSLNNCIVPPPPANGYYRLPSFKCPDRQSECEAYPGTTTIPGSYLVYHCNPGYKLNNTLFHSSTYATCLDSGNWLNIPECIEITCDPLPDLSRSATCNLNGIRQSCDQPAKIHTQATVKCRNSYQQNGPFGTKRTTVRCNDRGKWEPEPITCVPVCGIINPIAPGPTLIQHGTHVVPKKTFEFPWHATLYRVDEPGGKKNFKCGATIIKEAFLLTAAHCVFDETVGRLMDPSRFWIATGNIVQDFDVPAPFTRSSQVKRIYIQCDYIGFEANYAWDIAILELVTPFSFTAILVPICLDNLGESEYTVEEPNSYGKVAGFGRTEQGESSQVLISLRIPFISRSECLLEARQHNNQKFVTEDKFCAGYKNGSAVCDGDSGGGLVSQWNGLWYLRGIVSSSLAIKTDSGGRTCDADTYALFSRVGRHMSWIEDVISVLNTQGTYTPQCELSRN